jgi:hypothetical protein
MSKAIKRPKEFAYAIMNIKETAFRVNESLFLGSEKEAKAQFKHKLSFDVEKEILVFALLTGFLYEDQLQGEPLAIMEVENHFYIQEMKAWMTSDTTIELPDQFWITIVSLSITHTRALFHKALSGTNMREVMIPIVNPVEVAKVFFPNMKLPDRLEPAK